ncbi:MAG: RteC domain-containing protein, partial [Paludibacter sp.]
IVFAKTEFGWSACSVLSIKELVSNFELVFNIKLTDIYRTYVELKNRNIPTKFIDNLKASLLRKIEEDS